MKKQAKKVELQNNMVHRRTKKISVQLGMGKRKMWGRIVLAFHILQEFSSSIRKNEFIEKGLRDIEELWGPKEVTFHALLHCS